MPSVTLTLSDDNMSDLKRFSWVNWSEIAREELVRKEKIEELRNRFESEKEFIEWSVELGRKSKKERFKRLLSELSPEEREKLLK